MIKTQLRTKYLRLPKSNFLFRHQCPIVYRIPDSLSTPVRMARKPHHIASTRWKQPCFLDAIRDAPDLHSRHLVEYFGQDKEYWLLNRLDNETAGILYFAAHHEAYRIFKELQSQEHIHKYYVADVIGCTPFFGTIKKTIWHHPDDASRMVINDTGVICETNYDRIHYDPDFHRSTLLISITKWVRHQIRIHMTSLWYPIVGDRLYINKSWRKHYAKLSLSYDDDHLHLWSIGLHTQRPTDS